MCSKAKQLALAGVLVWLAVGVSGCGGCAFKAEFGRSESLSAAMPAGGVLDIQNKVGKITVTAVDAGPLAVEAKMTGKGKNDAEAQTMANDTKVRIEPSGDTVKVVVDSPRTGGCKQVDVQLDITAPKDVSLKYRVDVGDVVVTAITGDISGVTDVGDVKCSGVMGNLDIAVDVGKINVQYEADAPGARNIQLSTDVGDIALTAPSAFSAKLHARTDVGSFDTELPLTIVGSLGKGAVGRDVQGTIGDGEGRVELKTDVGSIKIK